MTSNWWKERERQAAALFGTKRQPGSGSMNRDDFTRSDSRHDAIFMEVKVRASHAVRTLWEGTKKLAKKEKKTPVLVLYSKGKVGGLIVLHEDDAEAVLAEIVKAKDAQEE